MTHNLTLRLVSLGAAVTLLAGITQPVAADGGTTAPGDASAPPVTVNPNGPADAAQVDVTATTSDSGGPGRVLMGTPSGSTSAPCPLPRGITHLTDVIPLPPVNIETGPPAKQGAVVGVPTWFWADGNVGDWFKAKSLSGYYWSCSLNPDGSENWVKHDVAVPVVVWAAHYVWDFGDGSKPHEGSCGTEKEQKDCADSALGVANGPAVQNTYASSTAKGYTVKVSVSFEAILDGQTNVPIGPFTQGDSISLPVREIQSVLVPVPTP